MQTTKHAHKLVPYILCLTLITLALPIQAAQSVASYLSATRYNILGQVTGTILPDPDGSGPLHHNASRLTYNANGLLEKTENGELSEWQDETVKPADWSPSIYRVISTVRYTYDEKGRQSTQLHEDASGIPKALTHFSYDVNGRVECKAVRMNPSQYGNLPDSACVLGSQGDFGPDRITRYSYDERHQLRTEWRAVGTELEQAYTTNTYNNNLLKTQTDANGNVTELRYDEHARLQRRVYPSKDKPGSLNESDYTEYGYDANGNLKTERKRSGATIAYTYDKNNRLLKKDLPGTNQDVYYAYDLQGLTLYSRFGSHSGEGITNEFDGFGRLDNTVSNMRGSNRKLSYTYDNNGNRKKVTHPNNYYADYFFDQLNRAYRIRASGSTSVWINYDSSGRRDSLERNIYRDGAKTDYDFDDLGRLGGLSNTFANTASNMTNSFTYTPSNQIETLTYSNDQYYYFGNENRTGYYEVNGLNQYTSVDGHTLRYDANGNLTSDGSRTYTYDIENRLINITGDVTAALVYDPLGRLFQTTINGVVRQFLYDGDALISEYSSSNTNTPVNCYIHGDQVDEPLVQFNGACTSSTATRRLLHADHQGSIIAQSSYSGNVLSTNTYDIYGVPGLENEGRFGYTGQMWLPELGLYHYKARMYSPTLGRFLQTDPIGYADNMNMHSYVGNDPVNKTDPLGLAEIGGDCGRGSGDGNCGEITVTATSEGDSSCTGGCVNFSGQAGLRFIQRWESFSANPYKVGGSGKWTTGYGHEITDAEMFSGQGWGLTDSQAMDLLMADYFYAISEVYRFIKNNNLGASLSQNQLDALVSLTFNSGYIGRFPKLSAAFESGDHAGVARQFGDITNGGLSGLVKRRLSEQNMYLHGDYSGRP